MRKGGFVRQTKCPPDLLFICLTMAPLPSLAAILDAVTWRGWTAMLRRLLQGSAVASAGTSASDLAKLDAILTACPSVTFICLDVANGYSDLVSAALGEAGHHARSAVAVAGLPGVARVRKELVGEPMPNVVMSAYAVTARGLRRLMDCFLRRRPDISGFHQSGLIDRFVSQYCFSRGPLRAFVVDAKNDTGRVFGHYNKGTLSVRKAMNGRVRR